MDNNQLTYIVLKNTTAITELQKTISSFVSKEKNIENALTELRRRVNMFLISFDREKYKSTDAILLTHELFYELWVFHKLGYEIGIIGKWFLLAIHSLLEDKNITALDYFEQFIKIADASDINLSNAYYLAGMISYNSKNLVKSMFFFEAAANLSLEKKSTDWQSKIYVAELSFFLRKPQESTDAIFFEIEQQLKNMEGQPHHDFQRATLYLKWGNCYVSTVLDPKLRNPNVNNKIAIELYKKSFYWSRKLKIEGALLPVIIEFSLAQALLQGNYALDTELDKRPSEMIYSIFQKLRKVILYKREKIILAQLFFILGSCASFSNFVSKELCEIYLENARHQTLCVPSDIYFYSPVTKELLNRDEFVTQIDIYADELAQKIGRR